MRKIIGIMLVIGVGILTSCRDSEQKETTESTNMSTINDFFERLDRAKEIEMKYPMNGVPTLTETEIVEDGVIPEEIQELAKQGYEHYLPSEALIVECRTYIDSMTEDKWIAIELLDDQTAEKLTAFLDEKNQLSYYQYTGATTYSLEKFIEYQEGDADVLAEIEEKAEAVKNTEEENSVPAFYKKFYGEAFTYQVDYDFRRTIDRHIVDVELAGKQ